MHAANHLLVLVAALVALMATAASASTTSSLARRQVFKDTCDDALGFTAPKSGDTWKTGSQVTVSYTKPPGDGFDALSVLLMSSNPADSMTMNKLMATKVSVIADNQGATANTLSWTVPKDVNVTAGYQYFVRAMWTKKGDTTGIYSCSPTVNLVQGSAATGMGVGGAVVLVAGLVWSVALLL
ncbi:hypothetical protein BC828DRAFT_391563 [Blastocladiella britannica]|nr:hypothetical protein BC828DRAFT_391563 [Blastocladiella britannica]